jgi:hypothetical protein
MSTTRVFRIAALALPLQLAVFLVVRSVARELRDNEWHPFRDPDTQVVRRTERGGFD